MEINFNGLLERISDVTTYINVAVFAGAVVGLYFLLRKFITKTLVFCIYFTLSLITIGSYLFGLDLVAGLSMMVNGILLLTSIIINSGGFRPYLYNGAPDKIFKKKEKKKSDKPHLFDKDKIIDEVTEAVLYCSNLNQKKNLEFRINNNSESKSGISAAGIGLFIVFERNNDVTPCFTPGFARFDSEVSAKLIETIFYEGTQLHDGALIIRNGRIFSAGAFVTQSTSDNIVAKFGARHRAAKGISQATDCISLVVSEETGAISFFLSGEEIPVYRENFKAKLKEIYDAPSEAK